MNIGDVLIWGLRLLMLFICVYALLIRDKPLFKIGLSGLGGSLLGWGLITMLLDDPAKGLFGLGFGFAILWYSLLPGLIQIWQHRKGHWIQINDQKIWVPPGARGIDIYIELIRNPSNPASKVEKSVLPKKGEKDEEYKDRMR